MHGPVAADFRGMNILTPSVYEDGVFTSSYKNRTFYYKIEKSDREWRVRETWTTRAQGYMSSPLLIAGYAYLHLGNGRFCCIDLKSGDEKWRTTPFGEYWSMIANRDRILRSRSEGALRLRMEIVLRAATKPP